MPGTIKQRIKEYFSFTKKERIGIIVLVIIIVFIYLLPQVWVMRSSPLAINNDTLQQYKQQLEALQLTKQNTGTYNSNEYNKGYTGSHYGNNFNNNNIEGKLFYFDPNTLTANGWKELGIKEKTIQTILHYREKGGRFRAADDLSKIYGLKEQEVKRLIPYVRIEENKVDRQKEDVYKHTNEGFAKKADIHININEADTIAFMALRGIGSKLANRIVNFRNKLGGFYSIDQVSETFGLPDSTFQAIKSRLIVNEKAVNQFNINKCSVDELKQHPYIKWNIANAIIQYRIQHGEYQTVEDIRKIALITPEIYAHISPYLKKE